MSVCGDSMTERPVFVSDTMRDPTYDEPEDTMPTYDGRGRGYYCSDDEHCSCGCLCDPVCHADSS